MHDVHDITDNTRLDGMLSPASTAAEVSQHGRMRFRCHIHDLMLAMYGRLAMLIPPRSSVHSFIHVGAEPGRRSVLCSMCALHLLAVSISSLIVNIIPVPCRKIVDQDGDTAVACGTQARYM